MHKNMLDQFWGDYMVLYLENTYTAKLTLMVNLYFSTIVSKKKVN